MKKTQTLNEKMKYLREQSEYGNYNFKALVEEDDVFDYAILICFNYDKIKHDGTLIVGYLDNNIFWYETAEEAWAQLIEWQEATHQVNVEAMNKARN